MDLPRPQPRVGDIAQVRFTKWDGLPHWHYGDARVVHLDEGHVVVGIPRGTWYHRPGRGAKPPVDAVAGAASVMAFARADGYVATLNAPDWPTATRVYVDITTVPQWSVREAGQEGRARVWTVRMVDLDLDIVERRGQAPFIDDEDEFAEHQRTMGYPPEVTAAARECADRLLRQARAGEGVFGPTGAAWLEGYLAGISPAG